ncbi:MAG: Coq4 family protein [Ferruginibacter sp.]
MMHKLIVKLRSKLLVFLTHHMALPLLQIIRTPQKFQYTKEALHQLPEGTLGKELVNMLDRKNLELLPYYAKHDIKHILLQYDTTDEGEVCLQCFMMGNKHLSFPVVATVLYGIVTMPEHWRKFNEAYQRGAKCNPIEDWQWFTLLDQPVQLLIKKINENDD